MRCYLPPPEWSQEAITLPQEEAHHALHVMRLREGDALELVDGCGRRGRAEIIGTTRNEVRVRLVEQERFPPLSPQPVLVQALAREQKMDVVLQKATELGMSLFIPLVAERSLVKLSAKQVEGRRARWERIALGAVKQCGTPWLPRIAEPCALDAFLDGPDRPEVLLFGELEAEARPLREVLEPLKADPPARVGVVVGPEGDLSPDEKERLRAAGALPVSLGGSVLRSETASLYALSIIRYEFGGAAGPAG